MKILSAKLILLIVLFGLTGQLTAEEDTEYRFRFQKMDETVIYDKMTSIYWTIHRKKQRKDFFQARSYCSDLILRGNSDWRLPTHLELLSLQEGFNYDPLARSDFRIDSRDWYWTSQIIPDENFPKTDPNKDYQFYYVDFSNGHIGSSFKRDLNFVLCVRQSRDYVLNQLLRNHESVAVNLDFATVKAPPE